MSTPWTTSKRAAEIIAVFSSFGAGMLLRSFGITRASNQGQPLTPQKLRELFEALGPVFIKLGQILSTRQDMLPASWTSELEKLQSSVVPLPWEVMSTRIEAALGRPCAEVFASIDEKPIGSASIGQVYRATLPDGEEVVLKVTRPDQARIVEADLRLLSAAATQALNFNPELARYRPREMVQELSRAIRAELDLMQEGANNDEIAHNLAALPAIRIPRIYHELSSTDLLVQEFIQGLSPKAPDEIDASGLDRKILAEKGAEGFMHMVLVDRVFHADPHPGNLFALPENHVAFIDFGMIGRLSKARQIELMTMLRAIVEGDAAGLSQVLSGWGRGGAAEAGTLEAESAAFISRHARRGLDLGAAIKDLMTMMSSADLVLPPDLVLLLKALATADGTMKALDPEFDTVAAARPFVERQLMAQFSPEEVTARLGRFSEGALALLESSPRLLGDVMRRIAEGRLRAEIVLPESTDIAGALDRAGKRIAIAVVIAAFAMGIAPRIVEWGPSFLGLAFGAWLGLGAIVTGALWLMGISLFGRR